MAKWIPEGWHSVTPRLVVHDAAGLVKFFEQVEDVDATYRRALKAGGISLEEPQDMPYGDRRGMVRDPSGNIWQIATHQADVTTNSVRRKTTARRRRR
jgi:predicted enzyme related to lactoylglutathione lyase